MSRRKALRFNNKLVTLVVVIIASLIATYFPEDGQYSGEKGPQTEGELRVVSISDGDTLKVLDYSGQKIRVRLGEIDSPELGQAYGQQAKQALSSLCRGKTAVLRGDRLDQYGRTVARVFCDGVDANAAMVEQGYAWVYDRYVRDRSLYDLQAQARQQRAGLWADDDPMPPREYRRMN